MAPKRDADDIAEYRPVTVPADRRARGVFRNQRMRQFGRGEPSECGSAVAKQQQEVRHFRRFVYGHVVEVITQPKGGNAALAEITVKLEFSQLQPSDVRRQLPFFLGRDEIFAICEPLRQPENRLQQAELLNAHRLGI